MQQISVDIYLVKHNNFLRYVADQSACPLGYQVHPQHTLLYVLQGQATNIPEQPIQRTVFNCQDIPNFTRFRVGTFAFLDLYPSSDDQVNEELYPLQWDGRQIYYEQTFMPTSQASSLCSLLLRAAASADLTSVLNVYRVPVDDILLPITSNREPYQYLTSTIPNVPFLLSFRNLDANYDPYREEAGFDMPLRGVWDRNGVPSAQSLFFYRPDDQDLITDHMRFVGFITLSHLLPLPNYRIRVEAELDERISALADQYLPYGVQADDQVGIVFTNRSFSLVDFNQEQVSLHFDAQVRVGWMVQPMWAPRVVLGYCYRNFEPRKAFRVSQVHQAALIASRLETIERNPGPTFQFVGLLSMQELQTTTMLVMLQQPQATPVIMDYITWVQSFQDQNLGQKLAQFGQTVQQAFPEAKVQHLSVLPKLTVRQAYQVVWSEADPHSFASAEDGVNDDKMKYIEKNPGPLPQQKHDFMTRLLNFKLSGCQCQSFKDALSGCRSKLVSIDSLLPVDFSKSTPTTWAQVLKADPLITVRQYFYPEPVRSVHHQAFVAIQSTFSDLAEWSQSQLLRDYLLLTNPPSEYINAAHRLHMVWIWLRTVEKNPGPVQIVVPGKTPWVLLVFTDTCELSDQQPGVYSVGAVDTTMKRPGN